MTKGSGLQEKRKVRDKVMDGSRMQSAPRSACQSPTSPRRAVYSNIFTELCHCCWQLGNAGKAISALPPIDLVASPGTQKRTHIESGSDPIG